jgi:hypothetical protein
MACLRVVDGSFCGAGFQWQRNGVNVVNGARISGATSDQLDINPVTAADAGSYRCVLTNACGSVEQQHGGAHGDLLRQLRRVHDAAGPQRSGLHMLPEQVQHRVLVSGSRPAQVRSRAIGPVAR